MDKQQKIETIKNLLIKFADPKIEYDGITAYNLAEMILKAIEVEGNEEDIKNTDSNADRED